MCGIKSLILQPCKTNGGVWLLLFLSLPSFLLSFSFLSSLFSGLFSLGSPPYPQLMNCSLLIMLDSFQHKPLSLDMFSNMHDTWPKLRHVTLMQNSSHYNACIHKGMTLGHSSAKYPQFWCHVACTLMPRVTL